MQQPTWPLDRFHHIHLATKNIDKVDNFLRPLGLPLGDYNHPGKFVDAGDMNEEEFWAADYKYCETKTGHVQFMSPNLPGGYQDFLTNYGNRAYSLGFEVDDVDAAEQELIARGLAVKVKGRHGDGWGFTYFDTLEKLGAYLCIRQSSSTESHSSDNQASAPFTFLHHVHIIVPDIEAASAYMQDIGLPIQDYGHPKRGKLTVLEGMGVEEFDELGYKFVEVNGIHIQFMSPGSMDSPHKRFMEACGNKPRAFSMGFVVDDVDKAEQELISRGLSVLIKGRHENGWGFTYFDTWDQLGINICIRQSPRGGHL